MNSGVLLLTEDSFVSVHLQEVAEKGVDIFSCKTCVDHFNVEEKLVVGKKSGMAHFIELSSTYEILTIS